MRMAHQVKRVDISALGQQQLDSLEVAVVRAADQRRLLHLRSEGTTVYGTVPVKIGVWTVACLVCYMSSCMKITKLVRRLQGAWHKGRVSTGL